MKIHIAINLLAQFAVLETITVEMVCYLLMFFSPIIRLRSKNGKQNLPISTATVSMVHSVPELMVSSEASMVPLFLSVLA